jgi:bacteriocin-like protein
MNEQFLANTAEGELTDDELENVTGGYSGSSVTIDGVKYKVVRSGDKQPCYTGTSPSRNCGSCTYVKESSTSGRHTIWFYCTRT